MRCAAARGLAQGRVAVVVVAVPAHPAEGEARVVLARLCPAGEPGHVCPCAAGAGLDVHGQAERVLAEVRMADRGVALGHPHPVATDQIRQRVRLSRHISAKKSL